MKIKELEKYISKLSDEAKEKEVVVRAPNGMILPGEIKIVLKDYNDVLNHSDDNIKQYEIGVF